jgi:hypothetical protein
MPPKRKREDDYDLEDKPLWKKQNALAGSSSSPAKSKQQKAIEGKGEKRLARFRTSCPKNILERVERVKQQRYFPAFLLSLGVLVLTTRIC